MTGWDLSHARWRTSSFSGENSDCVEIALTRDASHAGVRDSKQRTGPVLIFPGPAFAALRNSVVQ